MFIHKKNNPKIGISIASNGVLLDTHKKRKALVNSGVDYIIFSIHGSSQNSVEPYMMSKFSFSEMMNILRELVQIKQNLKIITPILEWKYLLFEWNDTDADIQRAKDLATEIGIDSILFTLTAGPYPSKCFVIGNQAWQKFTKNMSLLFDFCFSWDITNSNNHVRKPEVIFMKNKE